MIRTITAIAIAAAAISAPAYAASDEFTMEIDLNRAQLQTVEGAKAEFDKVSEQIVEECSAKQSVFNLGQKRYATMLCEQNMMKKVVAYVDNENFTKAYRESK
ncbi:MAG: UrcA family protein [Alphaproteobacteria bacterium]|nr:UrcA family protein [Alphaproteobacteria bacterium]|tara:strand:- start:1598 stop:1906 length:309 start_codon:yes stop_codon:yes gene_type:complete